MHIEIDQIDIRASMHEALPCQTNMGCKIGCARLLVDYSKVMGIAPR